jgi:aminomethyltransferase
MSDAQQPPADTNTALKRTPLHGLHVELGAKMVPFSGYEMPLNYPTGIIAEHKHTRSQASLFDVSHMGQALLSHAEDVSAVMERLVPGDIAGLKAGRTRYTQLTNADGGIIDDLMVSKVGEIDGRDWLYFVINAARKDVDLTHIATHAEEARLDVLDSQALVAVQGPAAAQALARHFPGCEAMRFMSFRAYPDTPYGKVWISRSGYTGEDGFEVSLAADQADAFARALLDDGTVKPAGLGARDTLRLEAGLCLYGHDINETTSPVEADLAWSIGKRRRVEGGFPGADRILGELRDGPSRLRVGMKPEGRATPREGTEILDTEGERIGAVTSGAFSPTLGAPIAMGYVAAADAATGTSVTFQIRGKASPGHVVDLPFVAHRYATKAKSTS